MNNNYTDAEYDDLDPIEDDLDQSPRGLRRAANKSKKLEQELAQMRRELAFYRAGISLDDPRMQYFIRGYDGELEPESILQAAVDAGFLMYDEEGEYEESPEMSHVSNAEQRVMQASAGAVYEDATEQAALAQLQSAMEEGGMEAMLDVARQYGIPIATEM